jgi:hypothetical protein
MRYVDLMKNWREISVHLPAAEPVLVRDFHKYTFGRWRKPFKRGMVPFDFETHDWYAGRRGPTPAYWAYVKHGACHWLVNHNLELAQMAMPDRPWRIGTSDEYSTVFDGEDLLFDFNYFALGALPGVAYRAANGEWLRSGQHLVVDYAAPHLTGK